MDDNKARNKIYLRTFGAFLATYLVLMLGFSVFLVSQEKKAAGMELQAYALRMSSKVEGILQNHLHNDKQLTDIPAVKNELLKETPFFNLLGSELAIFTGDYKLLFNTNSYWRCSYTERKEGSKHYTGYAYLNPGDWFAEEEIKEIERYLYADPRPKKKGDLSGYIVDLRGFWVDDGMVIPERITVNSLYADKFDEKGNLSSGGGAITDNIAYLSGYKNAGDLPYFEHGAIIPDNNGNPNSAKRVELRRMVTDSSKLKETLQDFVVQGGLSERLRLLTYRYYLAVPYQNTARVKQDQSLESEFWTILGSDVNIGERCLPTLIFVGASCLAAFSIAALILSKQTYKTYCQQWELEKQRKEITDALAHDLKTPLSIISGYTQNLQENIHTEKRDHYANHIQENVERMDKIIRKMLELTRLESGFLQVKSEDVALDEICQIIIDRYKPVWEDKLLAVSLDGKAAVRADGSLLLRVIDNFFGNALDNTSQGGRISISISEDALQVYNSGSHIPESKMEEIWQPFKKGDAARSHSKGTGLGLAITRTILELHGFPYGAKNLEDGVAFWFQFGQPV